MSEYDNGNDQVAAVRGLTAARAAGNPEPNIGNGRLAHAPDNSPGFDVIAERNTITDAGNVVSPDPRPALLGQAPTVDSYADGVLAGTAIRRTEVWVATGDGLRVGFATSDDDGAWVISDLSLAAHTMLVARTIDLNGEAALSEAFEVPE